MLALTQAKKQCSKPRLTKISEPMQHSHGYYNSSIVLQISLKCSDIIYGGPLIGIGAVNREGTGGNLVRKLSMESIRVSLDSFGCFLDTFREIWMIFG